MKIKRVQVDMKLVQQGPMVAVAADEQQRVLPDYIKRVLLILKEHKHDGHEGYLKRAQELLGTKKMSKEMVTMILST